MPDADLRRRLAHAYENPRPEVQELVPLSARRILDLGCASGALGAALKERQGAEVVGAEIDPAYAADAGERLDHVVCGDVAELMAGPDREELGSFDCVIAADVLEHLVDPWATLRFAVGLLEPGGSAVVSVPNVRHWQTFWEVGWHGGWPRRDHGLFDRTHLRWFTYWDARALLEQAGLDVSQVSPQYRLGAEPSERDRYARMIGRTRLRPFVVAQYVLSGTLRPA
jgi:2-polyprenyl-3-methyl-5-hydroxy-6-metoxy-1,4-benzoquinol methylase